MAAVTLLGSATFTTASGTKTVTAAPAAGDLIVIVVAHTGSTSSNAPTDNNSGGAGTYSLINSAVKATSADTMRVYVRDALIASGTSTVFTHAPGATTGGGLAVLKVTGMTRVGLAAARGSGKQDNQGAATTPAPVLSATPLTANPTITAVFNATSPANTTVPGSFASLMNLGYSTPTAGLRVASRDTGNTSATVTWGGTSATAFASLAMELDTSTTHATTGVLTGQGSTVAGTAAHIARHTTTGVLTGPGAAVVGTASRTRVHPTSGALTGAGAVVAGTADRISGTVTHDTSGALNGQGSTVSGSAARERIHSTSGALTGAGSSVVGSATRTREHATSGVLAGSGATVAGSAARVGAPITHATSGALVGAGSQVVGSASRGGAAVTHDTSGSLVGQGAEIAGSASKGGDDVIPIGLVPGKVYDPDSYMARLLGPPIEERIRRELAQTVDTAAEQEQPVAEVTRKVEETVRQALPSEAARDAYIAAYVQAWLEMYRQRAEEQRRQRLEDEEAEAIAALLLML